MPRKLTNVLLPLAALAGFIVVSTVAWPNSASTRGDKTVTPTSATAAPATIIDFDQAFADATATPRRDNTPPAAAKVDFNQVFAEATPTRTGNTPTNREKLRNAGWSRINETR
jgi:hypothetical protein